MSKRNKIRVALSRFLVLAIVVTCAAVYQSGSKSTPNEKELVKNEENTSDEAMTTEEKPEEESQDANTTQVEGTREVPEEADTQSEAVQEPAAEQTESADASAAENTQPEADTQDASAEVDNQAAVAAAPDVNFTESSLMEWPVSGQVVIDYDMEHTVYFPTLNEYKYSPAIAISSEVDTPVASVANGQVVAVEENVETGTTVTVDLGNGYQAVYGQLKDVAFQPEQYVQAGATLGYVNEPTKYYTKEGANLYFELKKDGSPLDPIQYLP